MNGKRQKRSRSIEPEGLQLTASSGHHAAERPGLEKEMWKKGRQERDWSCWRTSRVARGEPVDIRRQKLAAAARCLQRRQVALDTSRRSIVDVVVVVAAAAAVRKVGTGLVVDVDAGSPDGIVVGGGYL